MKSVTLEQFREELKAQGVDTVDCAFICPRCRTVQSARDLIDAGAGNTLDEVEKYVGFSCVGRWTEAGSPRRKPDGQPCNWTLGGLFSVHKLEVITPDGEAHPHFEVATPMQARAHALSIPQEPES